MDTQSQEKNSSENNGQGNASKNSGCLIFVILIIIIAIVASCANGGTSSSSYEPIKCSSCGNSYYPGNSGGNYMSIARTSVCKKCYENFKWAMDAYEESTGHPYTGH